MIALIATLVLSPPSWKVVAFPEIKMRVQLPGKLERFKGLGFRSDVYTYTCDTDIGHFGVGYFAVPPKDAKVLASIIKGDPGSPIIRSILARSFKAAVDKFHGTVDAYQFGEDLGLPAAFAQITYPFGKAQVRCYIGSRVCYYFLASANPSIQDRFFDSVRLPGETHANQ